MRAIKENVLFIVSHFDAVFAPNPEDWQTHRDINPSIRPPKWTTAAKTYLKHPHLQDVLAVYERVGEDGKKERYLGVRKTPMISRVREDGIEKYMLWWGAYNEIHNTPNHLLPIPKYLESFQINGYHIRQVVENPNGVTWFALTYDNTLWEIDRE